MKRVWDRISPKGHHLLVRIYIIISTDTVIYKDDKLDIVIVTQCLSYVAGCFYPLTPCLPC